ncbi:site-specific integrase [Luteolibacter yonseiensis]|uniref:Site-specific integrase n=1 Tax=Luteolibacter yonseiensis TaxID=1144680 RepID=A0A934R3N7_9BACT|nr:site-specific integrase [Luteolibacter yonseiensis]MBK1816491.1 site-specific integrase [Luteolibacter yonseiensis]
MNETRSVLVKYRTVSITVFPWSPRAGVEYWKFRNGKRFVVRSTLEKAKAEAKRIAEETYLGGVKLGALSTAQTVAIRRMLEVDPSLALVDEFILWHAKRLPKKNCREAVEEFLAVKRANAGSSPHNVNILTRHLSVLPDRDLHEIGPAELPPLPGSARTRKNRRGAWITFFKWCVEMKYLPSGEKTAPQCLEKPRVIRKVPTTWERSHLETMIQNVTPGYFAWLCCGGWAGIRTEEICPDPESGKSPLDWADFKWDRDLIIIRPETDKNGHRRVVPILPALKQALWPIKKTFGRVGPNLPPHTPRRGGADAETTRLGKLVGGWRKNALRHTFISCRGADVGLAQTSMEAGNSESEAKKSYNDAKGKDEAEAWFAPFPLIPQKYLRPVDNDFPPVSEKVEKPTKRKTGGS